MVSLRRFLQLAAVHASGLLLFSLTATRLAYAQGKGAGTPHCLQESSLLIGTLLAVIVVGGPLLVYSTLHARSRDREEQLHARFDAALDERTRMARELHDTLLQGFTGVTLQLQAVHRTLEGTSSESAERLSRVMETADETLRDARRVIWDIRAPELGGHDLPAALERAARTATFETPLDFSFAVRGKQRRLAPLVESTALRIGREAIVNAVRHAHPSVIQVELAYEKKWLNLIVRDDGRGLDADEARLAESDGHWGVRGMKERAARANGVLDIAVSEGRGTSVTLSLPTADGSAK